MLNTPFSPWPSFTQEEADAVSRVLLSNKVNYWTGQECRQFETEFAEWADSKYAIGICHKPKKRLLTHKLLVFL